MCSNFESRPNLNIKSVCWNDHCTTYQYQVFRGFPSSFINRRYHPRWTRYFYCSTVPSLKNCGWPEIATTYEEHVESQRIAPNPLRESGKFFKSGSPPLPQSIRTAILDSLKGSNQSVVKKAGTLSNQRSTVAAAWLQYNEKSNFRSATMAWTGSLENVIQNNLFNIFLDLIISLTIT